MDKPEVVRQKRKYEKKAKPLPFAGSVHSGPAVFNTKDLNQYDFPSSDDEPFSQVRVLNHRGSWESFSAFSWFNILLFISSDALWFFRSRGGERSRWCVWVQEENRLSISSCTLMHLNMHELEQKVYSLIQCEAAV